MMLRKSILSALLVLVFAIPASALEVGEMAPAINIHTWVKGEEFSMKEARGKNIVVVEFWATWCGPCKRSIPHLTDVQLRYKGDGVIVLGVSTDQDTSKVRPFVEERAQDMDYTVGTDKNRLTWRAYCTPLNVQGIPHAFIVDREGRLYWHGNPLEKEFDEKLAKVVKEQPVKVDEKLEKAERHAKKYFRLAAEKDSTKDELERAAESFFDNASHDARTLVDFGARLMSEDLVHRDLDLLTRVSKKAIDLTNGENWKASEMYAFTLYQKKDYKGALKHLRNARDWCNDFDAEVKIKTRIERLEEKVEA